MSWLSSYRLRQLRRIRHSLNNDSIATLVHAFVASRANYCIGLLAGVLQKTTDKLQCILSAAASVVSNCSKYDRGLTQFRHQTLYWFNVANRIRFRLCIQAYKCQPGMAPWYLAELCKPVANIDGHRHLQLAGCGQLDVSRVNIRRMRILLCRTLSLECSSWLFKKQYTFCTYF